MNDSILIDDTLLLGLGIKYLGACGTLRCYHPDVKRVAVFGVPA
jgi:hypothetical protein